MIDTQTVFTAEDEIFANGNGRAAIVPIIGLACRARYRRRVIWTRQTVSEETGWPCLPGIEVLVLLMLVAGQHRIWENRDTECPANSFNSSGGAQRPKTRRSAHQDARLAHHAALGGPAQHRSYQTR